ncbi:MAG: hypothetical protein RH949_27770 [Coleofasciculus sp. A1-SPW-01]
MNPILAGFIASLLAGLATFVGALPVFLPIRLTHRLQAIALGFGGGVMLAATAFSLIVPGKDAAISQGASPMNAALIMSINYPDLLRAEVWVFSSPLSHRTS